MTCEKLMKEWKYEVMRVSSTSTALCTGTSEVCSTTGGRGEGLAERENA